MQASAVVLEDDPLFNAGRGAVLDERGEVEHDAALMCGSSGRAGGVAAVSGIRNPVLLARAVMEKTPHVLLVAAGAEELAGREGIATVEPGWHITKPRHEQWRRAGEDAAVADTVGAVALDGAGHLAAATSTGGIPRKLKGRVGDSPLPGAGVYAEDESCAVSASGSGEAIMRAVAAHEVAAIVRHAQRTLEEAVRAAVDRVDGIAGLIALDSAGAAAIDFNCEVFHRAIADADGIRTAVGDDWR